MKNYIFFIFFISISSFTQEKNCSDFKTGTFFYVNENFPEKIVRTESMQIETNAETGVVIYSSIKWTSQCSYEMTYEKIINYPDDVSDMIGQKIYVEILETNGSKMKVHAKSRSIDTKIEFVKKK